MPIDIASGNVHLRVVDVSIPGRINLVWERAYSGDFLARPSGPLGSGWTAAYFTILTRHAGGFELISPTGSREHFSSHERAVESGLVVRNLGANLELFYKDGRYVVQKWGSGKEILRYSFIEEVSPGPMRLASIECLSGQGLELHWSAGGLLLAVRQRVEGRELRLTYDDQELLRRVSVQSPSGSAHLLARYDYTPSGQLSAAFDALDHAVRYEYDGSRRLIRSIAKDGGTYSYTYDRDGRCVHAVGNAGYDEKRLRFLSAVRITEVTDSYGSTRRYGYLPDGQITSEWDPLGGETKTEFDNNGRIVARITPKGAVTRYTYDTWGNVSEVSDPLGASYTISYNEHHQPTAVVDPLGATWAFHYDMRGHLVKKVNPLGGATSYEFDENGNLRRATAPEGSTTVFSYREDGTLHQVTNPKGEIRSLLFDDIGNPVMQINPLGGTVQATYDARGKVTEIRRPDGTTLRYRYDFAGNCTEKIDGQGQSTKYYWGTCGRLHRRIDPLGRTIVYEWGTEIDRLLSVVDELGDSLSLSYDTAGRVIEERSFDGRIRSFEYDQDGFVSRIVCGDESIDVSYDACGRLVMLRLSDGSIESYEYDALGRMTAAQNAQSTIAYIYDFLGNIIEERQDDISIINTFDTSGQLLRRSSSLGFSARYTADAAGRITDIRLGDGAAFGFRYDPRGFEVSRSLPGGVSLIQDRDELGRVVRQFISPTHAVEQTSNVDGFLRSSIARSYTYDRNGAPTEVHDRRTGTASYIYDPAEQLTSATYHARDWESFEYTATGSLSHMASAHDSARLVYQHGNRLLRTSGTEYDYDSSGRRIVKRSQDNPTDTWAYSWNPLGRLHSVTTPTGEVWTYTYDCLGRRLSKSGPSGTTRYVWSGDAVLHTIDKSDVDTWLYDDSTLIPIAKIRGERVFSIVPDRLGVPRELIDTSGQIVWSATYSAWGKAKVVNGSQTDCPIRLPGQWYDVEGGLHYNRHRYFDPDIGQFISQDPLGIDSSLNLYRYAPNALNFFDLLGLDICANKKKGEDFKDAVKDELKKAGLTVTEEVTIKVTVGPNGETVRTRVDLHVTDANGNVTLIETKASKTAPYTDNQQDAGIPASSLSGSAEYRTNKVAGVQKGDPVPSNATVVTVRPGDPIPGTGPPPVSAPHPPPP